MTETNATATESRVKAAQEQAAGLRALADMVEQNPEITEVLRYLHLATHIFAEDDPKAQLATFAKTTARYAAKVEKNFTTGFASVVANFGGVQVSVQADRDEVCERVVTGTETVTKAVPDPEALAAVPTVEVTETVETYEWICRPLLGESVSS